MYESSYIQLIEYIKQNLNHNIRIEGGKYYLYRPTSMEYDLNTQFPLFRTSYIPITSIIEIILNKINGIPLECSDSNAVISKIPWNKLIEKLTHRVDVKLKGLSLISGEYSLILNVYDGKISSTIIESETELQNIPYNIAFHSVLIRMIAHYLGLIASNLIFKYNTFVFNNDNFVFNISNFDNEPVFRIKKIVDKLNDYKLDDFELYNYIPNIKPKYKSILAPNIKPKSKSI